MGCSCNTILARYHWIPGVQGGYPRPPKDLPPSPPPSARVCKAGKRDGAGEQADAHKQADMNTQPSTPPAKAESKTPPSQTRTTTFASTTTDLAPNKPASPVPASPRGTHSAQVLFWMLCWMAFRLMRHGLPAHCKICGTKESKDMIMQRAPGPESAGEGLPAAATAGTTSMSSMDNDSVAPEADNTTPRSQSKLEDTQPKAQNHTESQSRPALSTGRSLSLSSPAPGSGSASTYARMPSVALGTGVRAPGFLNQGDSEDSDA